MDKCENTRGVTVFGKNQEQKQAILFNPRCKQWSCDYCAEMNKDYWIHQATRGVLIITSEGREVQFVTLTSRPYATPTTGLYFFKQNWPRLNGRMRYHTNQWKEYAGIEWAYFLIPEHHKSGVIHAHILAATHLCAESIWKKHAWQSGFGWKIDVQELATPKKAAVYTAKYLHKGVGAELWPKGFRRVRHSQNWPMADEQPMQGWTWNTYKNNDTVWIEKNALLDMGWVVKDTREGENV